LNTGKIEILRLRPDRLWLPLNPLCNEYRGSLPGVKRPQRGAHYLAPSSVEVKNQWSYTCTVTMCPRGFDRDNFNTFVS